MSPTTNADTAAGTETPDAGASRPARITNPAALPPQRHAANTFPNHQLIHGRALLRPGTLVQGRISDRIGIVVP